MINSKDVINIALIYDFDNILSATDLKGYDFLNKVGIDPAGFLSEIEIFAKRKEMDQELAAMYLMIEKANSSNMKLIEDNLIECGKNIKFNQGIDTWFDRINEYASKFNINLSHTVISTSLYEFIKGSSIANNINNIFACKYIYNVNHQAIWPGLIVNSINKNQFLWRINKGVGDISVYSGLNEYIPLSKEAVPFNNMIYFGDILADEPFINTLNNFNSNIIAIYDSPSNTSLAKSLEQANKVNYAVPKDFSKDSELENATKELITKIINTNKNE